MTADSDQTRIIDDSRQLDGVVVSITYLHYIVDGTNG